MKKFTTNSDIITTYFDDNQQHIREIKISNTSDSIIIQDIGDSGLLKVLASDDESHSIMLDDKGSWWYFDGDHLCEELWISKSLFIKLLNFFEPIEYDDYNEEEFTESDYF